MLDNRSSTVHQEVVATGIKEKIRAQNREIDRKFTSFDARFDSIEKRFAELTESLKNFSDRGHRSMPTDASGSQSGTSSLNHGVMRLAKIILPRFSGDKLEDWLIRVEQFFAIHRPPDVDKVNIASVLMEDVAAQWHQSVQNSEYGSAIIKSWKAYRELLIDRFKEDPYEKMRAMFQRWREEDIIEKQKRKAELSPIQKYVVAKQSSMAMDSLMMLCDTGQNTLQDVTSTAEIVTPKVHDPASASDPLGLLAVTSEGISLDSSTEVLQHPLTTDLSLGSCSDELVKEPILLEKSVFATNPIMVKDSMVSQVSLSKLEPCLQVSTVSIGVGAVRKMEDDSCARSFESLQAPSAEVLSEFFLESATVMALALIPGAEKCVVLASQQVNATKETSPAFMAVNWRQFLELLPHYEAVLQLNFMPHNDLQRLFLLETYGRVLDQFLSRCESISFPLVGAATYHHVVIRVIQIWDPGGADANFLGNKGSESYTESL